MIISVVIPTYRRPDSLKRCLEGLRTQVRPADEVLVVTQEVDEESAQMLADWTDWPALKVVRQTDRGAVKQYNRGLDASRGDIVAITDDDSVPRPDWLLRVEAHFRQSSDLGGVGGPDIVYVDGVPVASTAKQVGVVRWYGRIVHEHHRGSRFCPAVDVLKGVNMSFRRTAIEGVRFDTDLRGAGAQTCLDMAFSFDVQRQGWRMLFDPEVVVDHYPARRHDDDDRVAPSLPAVENNAFNTYLTLRRHMRPGARRSAALLWANWVGARRSPGVIRGVLSRLRGDRMGVEMRMVTRRAWEAARVSVRARPRS